MSYLNELVNEIISKINNGVMFMFYDIPITPRTNDLPNHYIKKDGRDGTLDDRRIHAINDAQDSFNHDHSSCADKTIHIETRLHKGNTRFIIDIFCKRIKYVLDFLPKEKRFILITGYKAFLKKSRNTGINVEVHENFENIYDAFKNLL